MTALLLELGLLGRWAAANWKPLAVLLVVLALFGFYRWQEHELQAAQASTASAQLATRIAQAGQAAAEAHARDVAAYAAARVQNATSGQEGTSEKDRTDGDDRAPLDRVVTRIVHDCTPSAGGAGHLLPAAAGGAADDVSAAADGGAGESTFGQDLAADLAEGNECVNTHNALVGHLMRTTTTDPPPAVTR